MVNMKKRGILITKAETIGSSDFTAQKLPVHTQQNHYAILRHPLHEPHTHNFYKSSVDAAIQIVEKGVVAMTEFMDADTLFDMIATKNDWFITKNPARYTVTSFVWGMSFTFLVMPDGTYHKGWTMWPQFLEMARQHGIPTI